MILNSCGKKVIKVVKKFLLLDSYDAMIEVDINNDEYDVFDGNNDDILPESANVLLMKIVTMVIKI